MWIRTTFLYIKRSLKSRSNPCSITHREFTYRHKIRAVELYKKHASDPERHESNFLVKMSGTDAIA